MSTRMKQRRGTADQWTSINNNQGPILEAGEIGYESDTGKFKIGDGANFWISLPYFLDESDLPGSLDEYLLISDIGDPLKAASLDADGKLPIEQLPDGVATDSSVSTAVSNAVSALVDGAPTALNTLNELAAALSDDASYAATITTALGLKAPLNSPTFTGTVNFTGATVTGIPTPSAATPAVLGTVYGRTNSGNTGLGIYALSFNSTGSFNTALGVNSLYNNTTGSNNSSVGNFSLMANTTGYANTASGSYSLWSNTTGDSNTAVGTDSLRSNTTGSSNTASGINSLRANTTGNSNTSVGTNSLRVNTTGSSNTALGTGSLRFNLTGFENVAVGFNSLYSNTTGYYNTALGARALINNTTGNGNIALGLDSLRANTQGDENVSIGYQALYNSTTGTQNIALGSNSLISNTTGIGNIAIGTESLRSNTTQGGNLAIGTYSLYNNTTGNQNTAIGQFAGSTLTTGSNNTLMGFSATASSSTVSNEITIGNTEISRFRIPGIGIDWTSSNLPGGSKSYSLIATISLSGSSGIFVQSLGLGSYSSIYVGVANASMTAAGTLYFGGRPYADLVFSRTSFNNSSTWSYQNMGGGFSPPGNNNDIEVGETASAGGNINASLMIDGVSSSGGKYVSWQSGGDIYNGQSIDSGATFSNGQGIYLHTQPITGILIGTSSTFDGGTVYIYGSLK